VNPTLSYDAGVLTFTFQRPRSTGDPHDWPFSDSPSDCYYFMFPIGGGGPHYNDDIGQHYRAPAISDRKHCIGACRSKGA